MVDEIRVDQSYKDQVWLLPPSVEELIPEDHICFLIEALVDSMDFSAFDLKYAGAGHPAYHLRILLKILIMGVMDRLRSSRRFGCCQKAFRYTVELGKQEGLLDLSHLSTDGSKIKANAPNGRVLTEEELEFLLRFVSEELEEWARQDTKEDDIFGDLRGLISFLAKARRRCRRQHNIMPRS